MTLVSRPFGVKPGDLRGLDAGAVTTGQTTYDLLRLKAAATAYRNAVVPLTATTQFAA